MIIDLEYNPKLIIPNKLYQKINKLVADLFAELKINSVPIDILEIVRLKGYILKPLNELNEEAIRQMVLSGRDGHSYYDPKIQKYIIGVDNTQVLNRQRFTVMHEIGHILLGHKAESDLADKMANYFASYSLVPNPLVLKYGIDNFLDIQNTFLVSPDCAKISFNRYKKWLEITKGKLMPYEKTLIELFN